MTQIPSSFVNLCCSISVGNTGNVVSAVERDASIVRQVHPSGVTALYFAVRHQAPVITRFLIERGADVNPPLPGRASLIQMADALPSQGVYDALKAFGSKPKSARKLATERLPLIPAIAELTEADLSLCQAIGNRKRFRAEAETFSQRRLRQLLTMACGGGVSAFAHHLIDNLPTVDFSTEYEGCPLLSAASFGSVEIVDALLAAGARRDAGHAFCFAAERGHLEVAKRLLEAYQHKRNRGLYRLTAERLAENAAAKGYTKMAEFLLPMASARSAKRTERMIASYRLEFEDLVAESFDWVVEDPLP